MPPSNPQIQLSYQVCPIILTGGSAAQVPGGMIPLLSLLSGQVGLDLVDIDDLDDAFGAFNILPGGTLISQSIGKYPFANQYVAANAVIEEPLTLSVIMDSPMRGDNAWTIKQAVMTALKATLDQHNSVGGTYTVATPAFLYQDLVLTALTDNSRGQNSLPQNAWRFDFEKPLIALSDLQGAQNHLMGLLSNGLPTTGTQSGIQVGTQTGQTNLSNTIRAAGGLSGGSAPHVPGTNNKIFNYSPTISQAGFPYRGIG